MLALCRCGKDMVLHPMDDGYTAPIEHPFKAAGTKYRCEALVEPNDLVGYSYYCSRPRYHEQEGVDHGMLTGGYLW